jgi:hypothetical protein
MFIIYAFLLGIAAGYLRGGRIKNLTQLPLLFLLQAPEKIPVPLPG